MVSNVGLQSLELAARNVREVGDDRIRGARGRREFPEKIALFEAHALGNTPAYRVSLRHHEGFR